MQYQLAAELIESLRLGRRLGFINSETFKTLRDKEGAQKELQVVKCHDYIKDAAELIKKNEARAVYIYRDIRDVVVSVMNVTKKGFYHAIKDGQADYFLKVDHGWRSCPNILISRYEEMVDNRTGEVLRIAAYLGIKTEEVSAAEIARKFSMEEQKKRIQEVDYKRIYQESGRDDAPEPFSMLKSTTITSGKIKQWSARLTSFQIGMIEGIAGSWLRKNNYIVTQPWWLRKFAFFVYILFVRKV